jgi:hypothetical protein
MNFLISIAGTRKKTKWNIQIIHTTYGISEYLLKIAHVIRESKVTENMAFQLNLESSLYKIKLGEIAR